MKFSKLSVKRPTFISWDFLLKILILVMTLAILYLLASTLIFVRKSPIQRASTQAPDYSGIQVHSKTLVTFSIGNKDKKIAAIDETEFSISEFIYDPKSPGNRAQSQLQTVKTTTMKSNLNTILGNYNYAQKFDSINSGQVLQLILPVNDRPDGLMTKDFPENVLVCVEIKAL